MCWWFVRILYKSVEVVVRYCRQMSGSCHLGAGVVHRNDWQKPVRIRPSTSKKSVFNVTSADKNCLILSVRKYRVNLKQHVGQLCESEDTLWKRSSLAHSSLREHQYWLHTTVQDTPSYHPCPVMGCLCFYRAFFSFWALQRQKGKLWGKGAKPYVYLWPHRMLTRISLFAWLGPLAWKQKCCAWLWLLPILTEGNHVSGSTTSSGVVACMGYVP